MIHVLHLKILTSCSDWISKIYRVFQKYIHAKTTSKHLHKTINQVFGVRITQKSSSIVFGIPGLLMNISLAHIFFVGLYNLIFFIHLFMINRKIDESFKEA